MKVFVAFSTLLVVASASHLYYAPRLIAPTLSSQYHSQDAIGQYAFGYNDHLSNKQEVKSFDGTTRGSYSYIDANKVLQTVDYTADADGFRVAATNLPKAPLVPAQELPKPIEDTMEVVAAKAEHFAAIEETKRKTGNPVPLAWAPTMMELPQPVMDTPEVAAAKAEHFAAIEEARKPFAWIPMELPKPVKDTPEVEKAKAEHLMAIEEAKLQNSLQKIDSGISFIHGTPLIAPLPLAYNAQPFSQGFSYQVLNNGLINTPFGYTTYAKSW